MADFELRLLRNTYYSLQYILMQYVYYKITLHRTANRYSLSGKEELFERCSVTKIVVIIKCVVFCPFTVRVNLEVHVLIFKV